MLCYNHNKFYEGSEKYAAHQEAKVHRLQDTGRPGNRRKLPNANVLEERDFNFHKVWLQHLVNSLDGISNQRLRLAFWIIDHLDKENKLVMTQRAIAEQSGMSLQTVSRTLRALQEGTPAFLVKINSGAYRVNPEVIWKGSYSNRMGICYEYRSEQAEGEQKE